MDEQTSWKSDSWRIVENFLTASMGALISISPIIVIESSFPLEVALVLFFLNNAIIIDDWWITLRSINTYNLATTAIIAVTIIYHNALVFLTIWLLAAGKGFVPLSGYLLILFVISLIDIIWCQLVLNANPTLEKKSMLTLQAWKVCDVAIAIVYLSGFLSLYYLKVDSLTCALTFCLLYIVRRALDEGICRLFLKMRE